jgi:glycosyltransferase involved in cell wall biosynthesis
MHNSTPTPEVSVLIPARNEEARLADCLSTLVGQGGPSYEIIVVDDDSTDGTRALAESFSVPTLSQGTRKACPEPSRGDRAPSVNVIAADPLPEGWTGKCNAAWSGAKAAKGQWLLFTDADTKHAPNSIASGLQEAKDNAPDLLSYSPKQEVVSLAERALMPVIFGELATTYPPKQVCDPNSPLAAANGQYLLVRRAVYDAIGGHAAVATAILEDVELAKRAKHAGYKLCFHYSEVVSTRMYRSLSDMWEGWSKNLALLFPNARGLALRRAIEFAVIVAAAAFAIGAVLQDEKLAFVVAAVVAVQWIYLFWKRIRLAHFDRISSALSLFGLPLFAVLLWNSDISHKKGFVRWKGREYSVAKGKAEGTGAGS